MESLQGNVVVITGATAGVGRATAIEFAKYKAKIALLARDRNRLNQAKADVEKNGGQAFGISVDVADAHALEKAAEQIEKKLGPIDIWINNAMNTVYAPVHTMTPAEYKRVTEVTYLGYVYGTQAALKHMIKRNKGVIIQVGSALAYRGIPLQSAYCAAKHAIVGFTESLRTELLHDKRTIQVCMVHLPALNTPQFEWARSKLSHKVQPVPPIYQPELAAKAIVETVQKKWRELYVGLVTESLVTFNQVAPGLIDKKLAESGYDDQQTEEPAEADCPDNLFEPVSGSYGAHGRFDQEATSGTIELWLSTRIGFVNLFLASLAVSLVLIASFLWMT